MITDGDCFEVAAKMVIPALNMGTGLPLIEGGLLIHGMPTLQVEPFAKHVHAWVEVEAEHPDAPNSYVWRYIHDLSNGKDVSVMPQAFYYYLGRINQDEVKQYTAEEAQRMIVEHGHFGPWHDIPEGVL